MKCTECQHENPGTAKFCNECGCHFRKTAEVPSKDYTNPQAYTPKFLADQILKSKSTVEGERKLVTVLFADVADYTAMAEKLDPERVHQIMDGCFKILMDEIHRYEGTINQFTGDGVMALFGAPLAHEDHAQRACLAALGIQETLVGYGKDLEAKYGIDFKMRMGLNSGPVVVGSIGDDLRMDYTAIGDTTNLAFRIQGLAEPGNVLVSNNTYKMVRESFEFAPQGNVTVKGREDPVGVFRLQPKKDFRRPRLGYEREIYSEMVGRDNELAQLELQVMKAVTGEGSIVNIIGEAGIGKSRLLAELRNREAMQRVTLLEGRAISIGRNLSFHPIIDLLKHWARIKEDDTETVAFEKLKSAIRNVHPEELDEILPFVATLMGMKLSGRYAERVEGIEGEALEKLILKNVRSLITKATELSPIVVVIEDLHWVDTSSIELLISLFRLVETQKILFVNLFRPGHKETGDRIVKTIKERYPAHSLELSLQPLDERTSETLINNMLNITGLHHRVREQIIERSGGNPYFIEEVVRSFIDEGAVVMKNGAFEITEKINTMVIPQTINDVLMARIDRLEDKTRDLIKVASVIGRNFFHRILAEVAKATEDLDQRLSYLKDIQLIRERKRMEELEYLFKHALAQEAAYESILLEKRKELHLKVATSIERAFTERLHEFYGMLAYHYGKGEDEDKAEEYLTKAGEEALKSSASSEALHYYQEALTLYLKKYGDAADPEKVAMFEKNIAVAFHNKAQYVNAVEYFDRVFERWGEGPPKNKIIVAIRFIYDLIGLVKNTYLPSKRAKKLPTKREEEVFRSFILHVQALEYVSQWRFVTTAFWGANRGRRFDITMIESLEVLGYLATSMLFSATGISYSVSRRMLEHGKDLLDMNKVRERLEYDFADIVHKENQGSWKEIRRYDENLVDNCARIGEFYSVVNYIWCHGVVQIEQGRFGEAESLIEKLSEIWEDYENALAIVERYCLQAYLNLKSRKLDASQIEADAGISFAAQIGIDIAQMLLGIKARIQILLENMDGARDSLAQAKELIQKERFPLQQLTSNYLIAQFSFDIHLLAEAIVSEDQPKIAEYRKNARKSGKDARRTHARRYAVGRTEFLRLMGTYYWLTGKEKKALTWWNKSLLEGERLGARPELSRTYMEVGKRLLEPDSKYKELNGIGGEEYLNKARTMFQEMDLQWDLDELERVSATN